MRKLSRGTGGAEATEGICRDHAKAPAAVKTAGRIDVWDRNISEEAHKVKNDRFMLLGASGAAEVGQTT